ncbi:WecB/TagA/CpsF family glycosyltransferase [Lacinutrix neustonica]|uniref:WecB/TagA/CpsF family glycosyltransferase n=1 Tax=Lacinutrix neustonica TaxID=2980107 RepID=A0A9E8SCZ2_9FLAO|nr:WecB/TagA/CpsF family glycosyltransferase [Lacinutrix neustonica]WAC01157.1 WecB/TagA/CpsF family glycosyltransferase [Lacinutrix neustonica]
MKALLGFKVFDGSVEDIDLSTNRIINTINPHSYCMTKKDEEFKQVLKNSDILLPDGIGIVWASKMLHKQSIKKIAGFDIFLFLMKHLNATGGSCFFLGASQATLALIKAKTAREFPNVTVNTYSPPYKKIFSKEDNNLMIKNVNAHTPNVLFVGMTAPKQEKWAYEHKVVLKADIICSIGAVFDFYAGTVKRPSAFWINLGLEWLPRFLKEPKRLAERNLVSTPKFVFEVIRHKIKG